MTIEEAKVKVTMCLSALIKNQYLHVLT